MSAKMPSELLVERLEAMNVHFDRGALDSSIALAILDELHLLRVAVEKVVPLTKCTCGYEHYSGCAFHRGGK